jgi:hypothetical protein
LTQWKKYRHSACGCNKANAGNMNASGVCVRDASQLWDSQPQQETTRKIGNSSTEFSDSERDLPQDAKPLHVCLS